MRVIDRWIHAFLQQWSGMGPWIRNRWIKIGLRFYIWLRTSSITLALSYGRQDYEIVEYEDFLSPEECDHLIQKASTSELFPSTVSDDHGDRSVDLSVRKSHQCWLKDGDDPVVEAISKRVQKLVPLPLDHQEDMQVVCYHSNDYYHPHYDTPYRPSAIPYFNRYFGPRVATCLMYLNDDYTGGETEFLLANRIIQPKKGKAIVFFNIDVDLVLIPESIHTGCTVQQGTKWVANKWIRVWPHRVNPACIHLHRNAWMMDLQSS
jgi:prolyl 4-hydroxylase